jgi:hypothetical protein
VAFLPLRPVWRPFLSRFDLCGCERASALVKSLSYRRFFKATRLEVVGLAIKLVCYSRDRSKLDSTWLDSLQICVCVRERGSYST